MKVVVVTSVSTLQDPMSVPVLTVMNLMKTEQHVMVNLIFLQIIHKISFSLCYDYTKALHYMKSHVIDEYIYMGSCLQVMKDIAGQ